MDISQGTIDAAILLFALGLLGDILINNTTDNFRFRLSSMLSREEAMKDRGRQLTRDSIMSGQSSGVSFEKSKRVSSPSPTAFGASAQNNNAASFYHRSPLRGSSSFRTRSHSPTKSPAIIRYAASHQRNNLYGTYSSYTEKDLLMQGLDGSRIEGISETIDAC